MRDFLIHGYFGVDLQVVWVTAERDVPALRRAVEQGNALSARLLLFETGDQLSHLGHQLGRDGHHGRARKAASSSATASSSVWFS